MTDRLDELQRLHDACEAARSGGEMATYLRAKNSLTNAAEEALPALLRVAMAAEPFDAPHGYEGTPEDVAEIRAALAELRGTDG